MGKIKLGICQKSLGLPFRRLLPAAQQLGVSAIELEATGELAPQNLTQTGRREIGQLLRSHDLAVSAVVCPLRRGVDVAESLEARLEHIRDTMALAFELGARLVILPIGQIPEEKDEPAFALMKESLDSLGKHGDRTGVTLALETGEVDPAALVTYLNRLDAGSLAVNFNPAHLVLNGFNPYDAVRTFARRLAHAHAQDARRISPSKWTTVTLGHGDIDWLQLLAHFEEIDYRGPLTILGADRAELVAGAAFLRRFVV